MTSDDSSSIFFSSPYVVASYDSQVDIPLDDECNPLREILTVCLVQLALQLNLDGHNCGDKTNLRLDVMDNKKKRRTV